MRRSAVGSRSFATMVRLVAMVFPLVASGAWAAQPQEGRRHTEKAGGFSFVVPEGWTVRDFPGLKYKIVVGPARDGFAANMNVVDEAFRGSIDDYLKATLASMKQVFKDVQIEENGPFETKSGSKGGRIVAKTHQGERFLRQTFYCFGDGATMYVVTCSALAEGGKELDPLFERAMKTFRLEGKDL